MPKDGVKVKCVSCKSERTTGPGEVADNDFPMCDKCFMPIVPIRANIDRRRR